jgi:hypothetical protein
MDYLQVTCVNSNRAGEEQKHTCWGMETGGGAMQALPRLNMVIEIVHKVQRVLEIEEVVSG